MPGGRSRKASSTRTAGLSTGWRLVLFSLVLGALLIAVLTVPFLPAAVGPEVRLDYPAPYTVKSPVTTRYVSKILTEADREAAAAAVGDVYRFDPTLTTEARQALSTTLGVIGAVLADPELDRAGREQRLATLDGVQLTADTLAFLVTLQPRDWPDLVTATLRLYDRATSSVLNPNEIGQMRAQDLESIRLQLPGRVQATLSAPKRQLVIELVGHSLVPNYVVDQVETDRRRQEARLRTPDHIVQLLEGELIVYEGQIVRETDLEKMEAAGLRQPTTSWSNTVGQAALVAGLLTCFGLFLYRFREKTGYGVQDLLLIGMIIVATLTVGKFLVPGRLGMAYSFPLPTASILLALLLNPQVALGATLVLAVLVGVLGGGSLELAVLGIAGGLVGILGIWKAQRSSAFLFTGVYITLVNLTVVGAFRLIDYDLALSTLGTAALACAINGFASAALGFVSFSLLGNLFGRVTVLQLMELANPNHPLLHRLMREAPGTYYHSIIVGNLAERAAEVIGADPMLVRVGAYYHDIGKVVRPYFFVDNQAGRSNIHDDLPPRSSAQIITDHVRDGIALARKYRLPERIVQFIPQHHGTTNAAYFYRRALQEDETVNPEDFRYPGPRPQSREAAILMLADSVEAIVRSMNQSGKLQETIEGSKKGEDPWDKLVSGIIAERIREGQLDESDLTFRDLHAIQHAFAEMLHGVYHPRVVYPEFGKEPPEGDK